MMKKNLIFLILCTFITSCNKNVEFKPFIKVIFLKGSVDTVIPINCQRIKNVSNVFYQDTIINNEQIIKQIIEQLASIKADKEAKISTCDIRIKCIFYKSVNDSLNLCLGENNCIVINDEVMKTNYSLNFTIKSSIGYYNYFSKEELGYFDELKGKYIFDSYIDLRRKRLSNGIPLPPK